MIHSMTPGVTCAVIEAPHNAIGGMGLSERGPLPLSLWLCACLRDQASSPASRHRDSPGTAQAQQRGASGYRGRAVSCCDAYGTVPPTPPPPPPPPPGIRAGSAHTAESVCCSSSCCTSVFKQRQICGVACHLHLPPPSQALTTGDSSMPPNRRCVGWCAARFCTLPVTHCAVTHTPDTLLLHCVIMTRGLCVGEQ